MWILSDTPFNFPSSPLLHRIYQLCLAVLIFFFFCTIVCFLMVTGKGRHNWKMILLNLELPT
ncbi:hypothetical protein C0J52_23426 [Blattella germanica]|nr:hypothetical protein C0J52_23426 [Blattella germanica]